MVGFWSILEAKMAPKSTKNRSKNDAQKMLKKRLSKIHARTIGEPTVANQDPWWGPLIIFINYSSIVL